MSEVQALVGRYNQKEVPPLQAGDGPPPQPRAKLQMSPLQLEVGWEGRRRGHQLIALRQQGFRV